MTHLGDVAAGAIVRLPWSTNAASGASITRGVDGTVQVYKDGVATSESTTGVTDTEDFDGLTGAHLVTIDTSADATFYAAGHEYQVMAKAMTIDGLTVNVFLGCFSIANRAGLLDVANGVETGLTVRGALRLALAVLAGKRSGTGTGTETFRNTADTKARVVSSIDSLGNRTNVTTDGD